MIQDSQHLDCMIEPWRALLCAAWFVLLVWKILKAAATEPQETT